MGPLKNMLFNSKDEKHMQDNMLVVLRTSENWLGIGSQKIPQPFISLILPSRSHCCVDIDGKL